MIGCWFVMMVLSTVGIVAMETWPGFRAVNVENVLAGLLFGQIALATILGGLIARSWVTSWFVAVLLACFQTVVVAFCCDSFTLSSPDALERLSLCSLWPVAFLSTSAPLVALRSLWGWTLTREAQTAIPRWRSSLEDLILVGVVIACSMTISRVFLYSEGPNNLPQLLVVMGLFAALSFICVPLVVYVSFRAKSWPRRIAGWLILSAIGFVVIFIESMIMQSGGWSERLNDSLRDLRYMLVGVPAGCATVAIGITALLASGYRMTYFQKTATVPEDQVAKSAVSESVSVPGQAVGPLEPKDAYPGPAPFKAEWLDDTQPEIQRRPFQFDGKWQARAITALLVCIASVGVFSIQVAKQRFIRFHEELATSELLHVRFTMVDQKVQGLDFGPDFSDADLQRYTKHAQTITSLSFAGTKVTDAILQELGAFPNLVVLDLSSTAITDDGLQELKGVSLASVGDFSNRGYSRLSVANTKVSWSAANQLAERLTIKELNLGGLGITDAQLATPIKVNNLTLSRNPISDAGIAALLEQGDFYKLDLSDTSITGSTLNSPRCPQTLILDGTQISDANLLSILKLGRVQKLSLARTNVTAAVLPKLAGLSIRLGSGRIIESDLANLKTTSFEHLGLNDQQFSGRCLLGGNIQTRSLDLSNSSVTDEIVISLMKRGWREYLGLANTQISDACMGSWTAGQVDVRGTRVTAAGLAMEPTYGSIILSHDQFSPKEMAQLEHLMIEFDEPSNSYAP